MDWIILWTPFLAVVFFVLANYCLSTLKEEVGFDNSCTVKWKTIKNGLYHALNSNLCSCFLLDGLTTVVVDALQDRRRRHWQLLFKQGGKKKMKKAEGECAKPEE
jgi:hypothetical protein